MARYHVTPEENWASIRSSGLTPSTAHECDCGVGVHLAPTVDAAHEWIARLRNERDEYYYAEFLILEVDVPEEMPIVEDQVIGVGLRGEIACTQSPISPERIGVYERF